MTACPPSVPRARRQGLQTGTWRFRTPAHPEESRHGTHRHHKGGSAYNVYPGTVLTQLIAPFVGQNNNLPEVSHWFLCHGPAGTTGGGGGTSGGGAATAVETQVRFTGYRPKTHT